MPQVAAGELHERSERPTRPDDGDNTQLGGTTSTARAEEAATTTASLPQTTAEAAGATASTGSPGENEGQLELYQELVQEGDQGEQQLRARLHQTVRHIQEDTPRRERLDGAARQSSTEAEAAAAIQHHQHVGGGQVSGASGCGQATPPNTGHFQLPLRYTGGFQQDNTNDSEPSPTTPSTQQQQQQQSTEAAQHQIFQHPCHHQNPQQQPQQPCQLRFLGQHTQSSIQQQQQQQQGTPHAQTFSAAHQTCTGGGVCCGIPRGVVENSGMPRSPSHDSCATDLSLFSLSSCGSEISRIIRCGSSTGFASQGGCCGGGGGGPTPLGSTPVAAVAPAGFNADCNHVLEIAAGPGHSGITTANMACGRPPSAGGASDLVAESPVGLDECAVAPLIQVHDATLSSSSTSAAMCTSQGGLAADHRRSATALHNRCTARNSLLQVPAESYGGSRVHDPCTLFEEESEAIRNCSLLSSAVLGGLMKSFSTGDISHGLDLDPPDPLRNTVSEELITDDTRNVTPWNNLEVPVNRRLDCASRSCSTWVAVGDMHSAQSTSQLPSPSARCGSGNIPGFTAADLVRSVNKKVRQMYIRRRLLSTYKALERLTKSQLNLSEALQATGPQDLKKNIQDELRLTSSTSVGAGRADGRKTPLTARDVERDRGKPLTKYERNMMIFNWLHNLDEDGDSTLAAPPPFDLPSASGSGNSSNGGQQHPVQQAA